MRSNTLTPLLQFIRWWGIDPWYAAGIDYDNSSQAATPSALRTSTTDQCDCMVQHPWDSFKNWSRDDLIAMLEQAETFFLNETNFYPAPYYIEGEQKAYPAKNNHLGYSTMKSDARPKTIKPYHPCNLQGFATYSLELVDTVSLTRDDGIGGDVYDEFTATVVVPSGTLASELRVYFTASDGGYTETPGFNDHLYEIRPLTIAVNGVNATITGPAYLFKLPTLDEIPECHPHDQASYVEDIAVYLVVKDECSQGNFICFVDDCQYVPCEPVTYPLCMGVKQVGRQTWGMAYPAECNESEVQTRYCLSCAPDEVQYNYVNGVALLDGGYMPAKYVNVLSMLAVGLADCVKEWCDCLNCPNKKVNYYRTAPLALVETDKDASEYNLGWQLVLSKATVQQLAGLPPYNGILQALRFINTERCISTEGATYV